MKSGPGLFHEDLLLTHNRAPVTCKLYFQATWSPHQILQGSYATFLTLPQTALHPCLYLPIVLIKETGCENVFPKGKSSFPLLGKPPLFPGMISMAAALKLHMAKVSPQEVAAASKKHPQP